MPATITDDFVNHRVNLLAKVFLTRLPTIQVNRLDVGHVQLLAIDLPDEKKDDTVRSFGIILWGTAKPLATEEDATKDANSHWRRRHNRASKVPPFSFPVLALVSSVENDLGYYAWAWEPSVDEGTESPLLHKPVALACSKIHSDSLDKIVSVVRD